MVLKYLHWQYRQIEHLQSFYQLVFGIVVLQVISYYLSVRAEEHHIMTMIMVRMLFFGIQVVLFLIIDERLHFFQFKVVHLTMVTCVYELCAGHVTPLLALPLFYILAGPQFKRREKHFEKEIKEALENDEHLYYYSRNMEKPKPEKPKYDMVGKKAVREAAETAQPEEDRGDQDAALPIDSSGSVGPGGSIGRMQSTWQKASESQFFDSSMSVVLLCVLIWCREPLTPDIFHFVMCVDEEEVHFLFVSCLWLFFRCWLEPDPSYVKQVAPERIIEERVKIVTRSALEMGISLLVMQGFLETYAQWAYCFGLFALIAVRTVYKDHLDLTGFIFVIVYFSQNFIVNMIDFVVYKNFLGYYHDEQFLKMFSYKVWQFWTCLLVSFVYAQTLIPSFEKVKENPSVLSTLFKLLIPSNMLMLATFLFELTVYDQHQRQAIFESHLAKVFFSINALYFLAIIFSHWVQQLIEYSQKYFWENVRYETRLEKVLEEINEMREVTQMSRSEIQRLVNRKMSCPRPQIELIRDRMESYHPGYCLLTEYVDYLTDSFDAFLVEDCEHFTQTSKNQFTEVMRQVQTQSAIVFFILIHVPLSRQNSLFCFVTALMPMMLNLKSKYWFYERTNDFVVFVFGRWDPEAKNHVQKPSDFKYEEDIDQDLSELDKQRTMTTKTELYLTKEEAEQQENAVYSTISIIALFFSLFLNFLMSVYLQEVLTDSCNFLIRFFDGMHIDIHFIRYLYLSMFDTRPPDVLHSKAILQDSLLLAVIVVPLFVVALRFQTAPVYINYTRRINAFVMPFALIVVFTAHHTDVVLLGLLVGWLNFQAFYYHTDMPSNVFQIANKRVRGKRLTEQIIEQLERREKLQYGSTKLTD